MQKTLIFLRTCQCDKGTMPEDLGFAFASLIPLYIISQLQRKLLLAVLKGIIPLCK